MARSSFVLDGLRTVRGRLAFRDCDPERVGGNLDVGNARARPPNWCSPRCLREVGCRVSYAVGVAPAPIDSLTLVGVAALHWAGAAETAQDVRRPGQAFTVGRLAVHDNPELTALPVLWESVSSLDVRNNAALADVWVPDEAANPGKFRHGLRNISIVENPQLGAQLSLE